MRKTHALAATAAVLIAGGALVAFGGSGPTHNQPSLRDGSKAEGLASGGAGDVAADEAAAPASPRAERAAAPRVVRTATLDLSVQRDSFVAKATAEANRIAEANGGFVANTESSKGEDATTSLTLRVPVAAYDATLTALRHLGNVESESLGGRDVTGELVDLDARLRSLRAQETALNALMAKANTVGETLQVAQAVADVRTRIERLAAQQAQLADQADFATIAMRIAGPRAALGQSPAEDPLLVGSLRDAAGAALAVLGGVIVLLGYLLPAGLLAGFGFGLWRLFDRRRPAVA